MSRDRRPHRIARVALLTLCVAFAAVVGSAGAGGVLPAGDPTDDLDGDPTTGPGGTAPAIAGPVGTVVAAGVAGSDRTPGVAAADRPTPGGALARSIPRSGRAGGSVDALHSNHVGVWSQVIDGAVRVDGATVQQPSFVVIRRAEGREPGEPIGHVAVSPGLNDDLTVELSSTVEGEAVLWAVLHADENRNGEFDPGEDPAIEVDGRVAGRPFLVRSGEAPAYLLTRGERVQSGGTVRFTRVGAPEDGFVVLHADDRGDLGRVLGSTAVSAGSTENVTVAVDEFRSDRSYEPVWGVLYADADDDGEFDPDSDRPVEAGNLSVRNSVVVENPAAATVTPTETATATPTDTETPTRTAGTPTGTETPTVTDSDPDPTATATDATTPPPTGTAGSPTATTAGEDGAGDAGETGARDGDDGGDDGGQSLPGFGPVVALVALAILLARGLDRDERG